MGRGFYHPYFNGWEPSPQPNTTPCLSDSRRRVRDVSLFFCAAVQPRVPPTISASSSSAGTRQLPKHSQQGPAQDQVIQVHDLLIQYKERDLPQRKIRQGIQWLVRLPGDEQGDCTHSAFHIGQKGLERAGFVIPVRFANSSSVCFTSSGVRG